MTSQGPGEGSGHTGDQETVADELRTLTKQLRATIQSFGEGELRRQERLTQFDQHLMQMEASIREEVARLRSTGSVVEALAGEVRQAVDGLARLGFDPTHEQLHALQSAVAKLPASLPTVDLTPIHEQLHGLQGVVEQLPPRAALVAIETTIVGLAAQIARLPVPDDAALLVRVDRLAEEIDALRTTTAERFDALPDRETATEQQLALGQVVASADGLSAAVGALRAAVGAASEASEAARSATVAALEAAARREVTIEVRLDALAAQVQALAEQLGRAPISEQATWTKVAPAEGAGS